MTGASLGLALALASACAARPVVAEAPAIEATSEAPVGSGSWPIPRMPDAVVVDPPSAFPDAVERATAEGVVSLREPLGGEAVRVLVRALVDAWETESVDPIAGLLTEDAGPIDARARGRGALVDSWRQRMHAHEYHHLAGVELYRPERIERYFWDDLSAPGAPARPPDMHRDELYVRVPLEVTRLAGERLFGDSIELLLRREDGKYRIAAYGEGDGPRAK